MVERQHGKLEARVQVPVQDRIFLFQFNKGSEVKEKSFLKCKLI